MQHHVLSLFTFCHPDTHTLSINITLTHSIPPHHTLVFVTQESRWFPEADGESDERSLTQTHTHSLSHTALLVFLTVSLALLHTLLLVLRPLKSLSDWPAVVSGQCVALLTGDWPTAVLM